MLRTLFWVVCVLLSADELSAQTLLRWKLTPGEKLAVSVSQQTESKVAFSGKETTTTIDLAMDLSWQVEAADAGSIRIKQQLDRVQLKLESAKAGAVAYDSAAQTKPTGSARDIAAALQPLIGAQIELTMDGRGQVTSVKPVGAAAEKLFAAGPAEEGAFSPKALQQLLKQPLLILPEPEVAKGDSWKTAADLEAAAGKFKQETTSKLGSEVEVDGEKLVKITHIATLKPAGGPSKSRLTLKSHAQSGTALVSAAGRLASAEQSQTLVTERPYREATIAVTLTSKQTTTLKAAAQ